MKLEPLNTSVVVLANGHNPTILHHEFLKIHGIVPADWELNTPEMICTAAVSVVKYNGEKFAFLVDNSKFQATDNAPSEHPENSLAAKIATDYISHLPHVKYTAVGINFSGIIPIDCSEQTVLNRFLKEDESWQKSVSPVALGVKLSFKIADGRLTLSVDSATIQRPGQAQMSGILVDANCHFDLGATDRLEHAKRILSRFVEIHQIVKTHINAVMGLGV